MATSFGNFGDTPDQNLTLHEMFRVVGDQLLPRDVRVLKFLYTGVFPDDLRAKINDGFTFFLALERIGRVDTSNFKYIINVLRIIVRQDLIPLVTLRRRKTVEPDPVDLYLEETARISSGKRKYVETCTESPVSRPGISCPSSSLDMYGDVEHPSYRQTSPCTVPVTPYPATPEPGPTDPKRRRSCRRRGTPTSTVTSATTSPASTTSAEVSTPTSVVTGGTPILTSTPSQRDTQEHQEIRKKVTCDIRLRVRAEYCHHESALQGNVFSNKPELLERQFEKFMQANTILKSRDLGSIICDIKFSELTYLDAFWRDYINGSLLEALKGVFITESLKQAVGHEAIKLLVNVDEDDYEAGRKQLLRNLQE